MAHDKAPARDDLVRQQRWRGVRDHEVRPTLSRGPEILGRPLELRALLLSLGVRAEVADRAPPAFGTLA